MSKVEVTYVKGGRRVSMRANIANALFKMGHVEYVNTSDNPGYKTRMLTAAPPPPVPPAAERVSDAVLQFAADNDVDVDKVEGTGKDGRVRKSDIEAVIAARG